jgi:fatty-acyl-CoA synthase
MPSPTDASGHDPLHQSPGYADLVMQGLRRWPDRVAVIDATGLTLTYKTLEQRIWQFAGVLAANGLQKGQGLAQLASNRIDGFITMIASMVVGARYTPLHPMGSLNDQRFILKDAEISILVVDTIDFKTRGRNLVDSVPTVLSLGTCDYAADLVDIATSMIDPARLSASSPTDISWLTYTGGTTGQQKGVILTQANMAASCLISTAEWEWPEQISYLACSPISHAAGFLVTPTLLKGGTITLLPGFDPDRIIDLIEDGINTLFLVPTMIYALLDHPRIQDADLSNLELLVYASAPMSPPRLRDALHLFGPVMMQCYGQTENIHLTMMRKSEHDFLKQERLLSCGRPPAGMQTEILNEDNLPVPVGEIAEVCARGPSVMSGYWKQPETTQQTLNNGWLRTGDLGRKDEEGFIYLVDRTKDVIISGGFNIYPKEVENVLQSHPAVSNSAVIGAPDEKWGERVVAFVVWKSGKTGTRDDLVELVRDEKGPIQAPKEIHFVNELPLTSLGKIDKQALRTGFWHNQERMVN